MAFPVSEVMLSLLAVVGDFCWGGVRHCFTRSSSAADAISSPMRILSRLPSSMPFPSHRPQGNLAGQKTQTQTNKQTNKHKPLNHRCFNSFNQNFKNSTMGKVHYFSACGLCLIIRKNSKHRKVKRIVYQTSVLLSPGCNILL